MTNILDKVNSSADVKTLSLEEMTSLSAEVREVLIKKINAVSGHLAPNLGFVEATIALHNVFNLPTDKIVFDISHQVYTHKILTGRKDGYLDETKYHKYSGFTNPAESDCDLFQIGHTSTSVSLAVGLAKGRDINKKNENIIAVIGDGSLTGGEAYEGLNNAAILNSNFIVIVNDNGMSIAENQGGLDLHLKQLKESKGTCPNNLFKALGFDYLYVDNGNNIADLIEAFKKVKDTKKPVVVHLKTIKGKGYADAEQNPEKFHYAMPNFLDKTATYTPTESYASITKEYILNEVKKGNNIVAVNPATPAFLGFDKKTRESLGEHFMDVGIAEQHAVACISGIAKEGAKPILFVASSFIQRSYDQLSQDLALNSNPATILIYGGAITGADATHLGLFDISMISNIPNIVFLCPTYKEEYLAMLDWSVNKNKDKSVVIRVPTGNLVSGNADNTDYSKLNKFKVVKKGEKVAVLAVGNFSELGLSVAEELNATLINPCYVSGIDKELLNELGKTHSVVITLEDGILDGGFGQKIASYYGGSAVKVLNFGAEKIFTDSVPLDELYERYHLTKELIIADVKKIM
ncbi:MAG: 1-deoxy-D-xylulose-5-phosphate synthase [Rickettsiales bacterium]|nr:MAG: 1-deoxy-D-xylulose-5-phosphate synthase [Rickettsiales bacterium]